MKKEKEGGREGGREEKREGGRERGREEKREGGNEREKDIVSMYNTHCMYICTLSDCEEDGESHQNSNHHTPQH